MKVNSDNKDFEVIKQIPNAESLSIILVFIVVLLVFVVKVIVVVIAFRFERQAGEGAKPNREPEAHP